MRAARSAGSSPASAPMSVGVDRIYPGARIWVGGQWFYLAGILKPAVLGSRDRHRGADRLPGR
jgi:putative ABC transport system permease protein